MLQKLKTDEHQRHHYRFVQIQEHYFLVNNKQLGYISILNVAEKHSCAA